MLSRLSIRNVPLVLIFVSMALGYSSNILACSFSFIPKSTLKSFPFEQQIFGTASDAIHSVSTLTFWGKDDPSIEIVGVRYDRDLNPILQTHLRQNGFLYNGDGPVIDGQKWPTGYPVHVYAEIVRKGDNFHYLNAKPIEFITPRRNAIFLDGPLIDAAQTALGMRLEDLYEFNAKHEPNIEIIGFRTLPSGKPIVNIRATMGAFYYWGEAIRRDGEVWTQGYPITVTAELRQVGGSYRISKVVRE